jgi:hypothetical protein
LNDLRGYHNVQSVVCSPSYIFLAPFVDEFQFFDSFVLLLFNQQLGHLIEGGGLFALYYLKHHL